MDFKKYIQKILSSKSKTKYILTIGLFGVLLILLSTIFTKNKNDSNKLLKADMPPTTEKYSEQLEKKINSVISKIEGVGNSEVLVTIENGIENIYANSEKKTTNSDENFSGKISKRDDIQKDIVLVDGNGGKQALMITRKEPTIKGVVVVCDGADDILIKERVTDAITKLLNITTNRLSVVKKLQN